jgi:hypothetical protein
MINDFGDTKRLSLSGGESLSPYSVRTMRDIR